jgi:LCP family protein required for cell wall assembly
MDVLRKAFIQRMTQRPRQSSIDGFVPSNQGRHIGFGNNLRPQAQQSQTPRVRIRRPGLHSIPTSSSAQSHQTIATKRPQARNNNFADFTSYTASQSTGRSAAGPQEQLRAQAQTSNSRPRSRSGAKRAETRQSKARKGNFFTRTSWKKVFKRTALVAGLFIFVAGGWLGWKLFSNTSKVFGGDSSVLGFLNATKLKGEDKGQVNILLAGVSSDDPGHAGGNLTDSIMLISIDTNNKKAAMLSIPRDTWVNIPGYGHAKINAANAYGDSGNFSQPGYPSGGMGLLEQVISQNFQIPIHYYAKINYTAFRDAVNAVGGVDVNIKSTDPRGLYDPNINKADKGPLKLPNGVQKLDGQTALNLARARGDPTGDGRIAYGFERSDFTRTEHQRQLLLALKDRITSGSVITNPLKIGELFDVVGKNMKTDLQTSEIRRMYDLSKQIKTNEIQSLSLNDADGVNLLASYRTPDGASSLIPAAGVDNFSQIQLFFKKATSNDPTVREAAKIVILNGGDITGLASKYSNKLISKGLNVVAVGDAPHQTGATVIIDQTKNKPGTKTELQKIFGTGTASQSAAQTASGYPTADFVIILGSNQKVPDIGSSDDTGQ